MPGPLDRRTLLGAAGTAAVTALAGCATISAELGWRTQRLGRVVLANSVDEPFEVTIDVVRDGTSVYEATHHLDPGSERERPQVVIYDWERDAESRYWEVRAKTPDSDWRSAELDAAVGADGECHSVDVVTGDWPEASVLVTPTDCGRDPESMTDGR
jgi:hypothetical protein